MANKFLVDIDLNGNEVQNFGIQTTATLPASPFNGQTVNHNGVLKLYSTANTAWEDVGLEFSAGSGISLSGTTFSVAGGTGLTQDAGGLSITDNGVGATQLNVSGNGTSGQVLTSDGDGSFSWTAKTVNTIYYDGTGIGLTGTTFSVAGGDGLTAEADGLKVDGTVVRTSGAQTIAGNKTFSNDVVVNGDLTVSGSVTTKLSEQVLIEDNIILLNSNETGSASENAGIEVERGGDTNVALIWDETTDRWTFTNDGGTFFNIPESGDYTNNIGDITQVIAGAGLTGGATSGVATLNVVGGTGITAAANEIYITNNGVGATQLNVSGNGTAGQVLTSDADGSFSWTNKTAQLSAEQVQDYVGGMVSSNTENGISVTYNDAGTGTGKLNFTTQFALFNIDVPSYAGGKYTIDGAGQGFDTSSVAAMVQVYEVSAGQSLQVNTEVVLDTTNNEIDVILPAGDYRIVVHALRN